jgi:hypothetical protein
MSFACSAISISSTAYYNVGISDDARILADRERIAERDSSQSLTMNQRRIQMLQDFYEARSESLLGNWDGYEAKAINDESFFEAMRFTEMIPITIPLPEIGVEPTGEIVLEWHRSLGRLFSIIATGHNEVIYAGLFGTGKVNGIEYFRDELPKAILDNLQRLFS